MNAVILRGDVVVGYLPGPNVEELIASDVQFDLVEVVPGIILNTPDGNIVKRIAEGQYSLFEIKHTPPQPSRIDQLESENAIIALELANAQIQAAANEQATADLILQLVQKGVI